MDEGRINPGEVLFGRYEIEKLLGEGGMGQVWAAKDLKLKRPVAIKIIRRKYADHPAYVARFERETQAVAQLNHPNIVQIYHADRTPDGGLYMVMERIPGVPLRLIVETARRVDLLSAVFIAIQIAEALGAAHRVGIWHRDIKPENIMVSDEGRTWVLDFGIAKQRRGAEASARNERGKRHGTGRLGTAGYMPPEEVLNQTADQRGDFYQLGVVLYEMLAGRKPFPDVDEQSDSDMLTAHAFSEPRPLVEVVPDCPEWIWPIVARLLEKDPDARYDDVDELIADLRAGLRQSAPPGPKNHPYARKIEQHHHEQARKKAFAKRGSLSSVPPEGATPSAPPSSPDQRMPGGTEPVLGGWSSTGPVGNKPVGNATRPLPPDFVPASPYSPRRADPALAALTVTAPLPPSVAPVPPPPAAPYVLSPPAVPPPSAAVPSSSATAAPPASLPALPTARARLPSMLERVEPPPAARPARAVDPDGLPASPPLRPAVERPPARLLLGSLAVGLGLAAAVSIVFRSRLAPPAAREEGVLLASASASAPEAPAMVAPARSATAAASTPGEVAAPVSTDGPAEVAATAAPTATAAAPGKAARPAPRPVKSAPPLPTVMIGGKAVPADKVPLFGDKPAQGSQRARGQELF